MTYGSASLLLADTLSEGVAEGVCYSWAVSVTVASFSRRATAWLVFSGDAESWYEWLLAWSAFVSHLDEFETISSIFWQ